jgi:hypothetical protein
MLPELRDMDYFSDAVEIAAGMPGTGFSSAVAQAAPVLQDQAPIAGAGG